MLEVRPKARESNMPGNTGQPTCQALSLGVSSENQGERAQSDFVTLYNVLCVGRLVLTEMYYLQWFQPISDPRHMSKSKTRSRSAGV